MHDITEDDNRAIKDRQAVNEPSTGQITMFVYDRCKPCSSAPWDVAQLDRAADF